MKQRTKDILRCILSPEDIKLLEKHRLNPFKYKLVEKNAQVKTFSTFDDSETINLRW